MILRIPSVIYSIKSVSQLNFVMNARCVFFAVENTLINFTHMDSLQSVNTCHAHHDVRAEGVNFPATYISGPKYQLVLLLLCCVCAKNLVLKY